MKKGKNLPQIKLSDAQKEKLKEEIKAFYLDVRGEEIGMIEQIQLLELFEEKMRRLSITGRLTIPRDGLVR